MPLGKLLAQKVGECQRDSEALVRACAEGDDTAMEHILTRLLLHTFEAGNALAACYVAREFATTTLEGVNP